MRFTLSRLVACAIAITAAPLLAQQPPRIPERGVELLAIDFSVLIRSGEPVRDLGAEEISIRVGGKRRTVRSLQLVTSADGAGMPDQGRFDAPPPFATNALIDADRTIVIIVDNDSFKAGREMPLREAVNDMLPKLGPRDRLSLVTVPYGGIRVPFTNDHSRVRTALSRMAGQATGAETGSELACRTGRTLESLIGYLSLQGVRDTPLTVMFITGGLAAPRRDAPVTLPPGVCELRADLFEQVGVAAGAARARFYAIQPGDSLSAGSIQRENIAGTEFLGSDNPIEGIEHLAGVTGGRMLPLTGASESALAKILRETSAHYVAMIDADRTDRSGRSQQLEISVKRGGVTVRARPRITFAKPEPGRLTANPSPREMLAVATVFRDLPLRATGHAALGLDGDALRVVSIAEPVEPGVTLGSLSAGLFDADGKLVSHWAATSDELQRRPVVGAMPAAPGAYRMRVAAIDTTGRSGTADVDITADLARTGPLKLSSLILGLSRDGSFSPRLQFGDEPAAIGYVEMYGAATGGRVTAVLELATTVNGAPMASMPLAVVGAGAEGRYTARGTIPIGALPAGDYVVRAVVALEGHPATRVVTTLRKALAR